MGPSALVATSKQKTAWTSAVASTPAIWGLPPGGGGASRTACTRAWRLSHHGRSFTRVVFARSRFPKTWRRSSTGSLTIVRPPDGEALRIMEAAGPLPRLGRRGAPLLDERALAVENLDAVVARVGDVDAAADAGESRRVRQQPRLPAPRAPLRQRLPRGVQLLD